MSETQTKTKDNIPLEEIPTCRLCSKSTEEELIRVCDCLGVLKGVHFSCLSQHIKKTGREWCSLCKVKFRNIQIDLIPLGFWSFLTTKEDILPSIVCGFIGFLFLYYILYLALIDFILSDGFIHWGFRLLLIIPTIFYAFVFTVMVTASVCALFYQFGKWREQNLRIEVKLITKQLVTEEQEAITYEDQNENSTQTTNNCPKCEETSNKAEVAVDIEVKQSTDNFESKQTLKANAIVENQLNIDLD